MQSRPRFKALKPNSDKETRLKRRKEARDKAREEANHNHHAPNIRPPIVTTIRAEDEELSLGLDFKLPAITVPLQKQYAGMHPVISSTQASITCASLGVDGVLDLLNNVLRTAYTLDEPFLREHLKECISNGHDFGMAYASLRPRWFDGFSELKTIMNNCRYEDEKLRREALDLDRGRITAQIRPRRVWDLFANRVVPIWVTRKFPLAISHSWMEPKLRSSIRTPINASKWPVPFLIDSSLERVRIELLNLGAEYVWLDVLCLRQFGDAEYEALRKEEWLVDVPTIGGVYHQNQMIVCYYSGLGRPFRVGDVNHERHWLKRAWTLQEISLNSICAGETDDADSPSRASVKEDGHYDDQNIDSFYERLGSLSMFAQETDNIFPVLSAMLERFAVNLNDKVAGMAYLLRSRDVPVYVEGQSTEDAWDNLLRTMNSRYLGDLLFLYPYAGSPRHAWLPSWEQIKKEDLPASGGVHLYEQVEMKACQVQSDGEDPKTESRSIARHRGYRIMECKIEGLSNNIESLSKSKPRRDGYAVIGSYRFKVQALHKQIISEDDCFTMVAGEGLEYWVVGYVGHSGLIRKHTVVRMFSEDRDRLKSLKFGSLQYSEYS
ncbi:hypothetical protein SCHPADRAFT_347034 [Schizopora paradoxa]|uniref:Heterokaryon incompatibility domain-containing protein n=1 Tax=Schizopora paradoxa TaxID=27342 RepID=A0A0H2RP85_9AGAM|nr:hypothetical protein SCHPADRAFT_347034 [Schizopora paradoxa]